MIERDAVRYVGRGRWGDRLQSRDADTAMGRLMTSQAWEAVMCRAMRRRETRRDETTTNTVCAIESDMPESKIKNTREAECPERGKSGDHSRSKTHRRAKRNENGENGNGRTDGGNDTRRNVRIRMKNKESSGNR